MICSQFHKLDYSVIKYYYTCTYEYHKQNNNRCLERRHNISYIMPHMNHSVHSVLIKTFSENQSNRLTNQIIFSKSEINSQNKIYENLKSEYKKVRQSRKCKINLFIKRGC